ncbi:hypothetical protein B0H19DRAFT_1230283, partial [Mycena capillaripes]
MSCPAHPANPSASSAAPKYHVRSTRSTVPALTPDMERSITAMRSNHRRILYSPPSLPCIRAPRDHSQRHVIPRRSTLVASDQLAPSLALAHHRPCPPRSPRPLAQYRPRIRSRTHH